MTVASLYATLVTTVGGSSGIAKCPTELPASLNANDLPVALVLAGPAQWNAHAIGLRRQIRTWTVRVFVKPVALGIGVDEGYKACFAPLNALGHTFLADLSLGNTIDEIRQPFQDSGVKVLEYGNIEYHGFEFSLDITDKTT